MPLKTENLTNRIKNLTNRPVLLRLNSGATLHIAPHQISGDCMEVEVRNNQIIQKLLARQVLSIHTVKSQKKKTESSKTVSQKKNRVSAKSKK